MSKQHARMWLRGAAICALALVGGAALGGPVTEVNLWVGRNVAPGPKVRLNINTRNVPVVQVAVYPIDGASWLKRFGGGPRKRPAALGPAIRRWNVTLAQQGQTRRYGQPSAYYSRQTNMPMIQPGVYLVSVKGGGKEAWGIVNVTHLAVVAKRSPKRLLVWVTDAIKGDLVPGARVVAYDKQGRRSASGTTGRDGVCLIPMKPGENSLVVSRGGDLAGVPSTGTDVDGRLRAHFQTDRPLYRPGQTIQYKILLRRTLGQGYRNLPGEAVTVEFRDPREDVLDRKNLKASAMGGVAGSFEIPSEGMLGTYTLLVRVGKDEEMADVDVQEYRKPEYKVEITPSAKRYLAGEEISFNVDAQYYFGAPVPQGQVMYRVSRIPLAFFQDEGWSQSDDGNLHASDTYRGKPLAAYGTVHTDKDGKVSFKFKSEADAPDSTYAVDAWVQDASRREVRARSSVPVYSAALRVGLRTDVLCAPLGTLVPIQVRAADLDGRPCSARVALALYKYVWIEKEGREKEVKVAGLEAQVPPTGKTTVNLPAKAAGDLVVKAVAPDGTGRKAQATMGVCVIGPFEKGERVKPEPEVSVRLDRRGYKPGDKVHAYIVTNQPRHPILATFEGADLWVYRVFPAGRRSWLWTIQTTPAMSPNAGIEVAEWHQSQPLSGNADFALPDATRAISVKAAPDRLDYRPGDKATYRLSTADAKGRPVPAEITLAVIDEALYALHADDTPDMWELYWGRRESAVATNTSAPEELSGGAYQKNPQAAIPANPDGLFRGARGPIVPVRTRFEDTAYWNAFVETGADGQAEVGFEMPGNLTTWRATARGVTAATSVGMGTASVKANREVMLRLATPRQMVQGDRIQLIGTIDNRSAEAQDFRVRLTATDIAVQGDTTKAIRVPAKSQAKVEWTLSADRLPASGAAQLLGEVWVPDMPADYADALRVPLRIAPRGVEERFMTGGAVADQAKAELSLPDDLIAGVGKVTATVWTGFRAAADEAARNVLESPRYGSVGAADHLEVAAATGLKAEDKEVRETFAMIARTQSSTGWGWWDDSPIDPVVTARVMAAIGHAREDGIDAYERVARNGRANLVDLYNRTNLWEFRALLASAAALTGVDKAHDMLAEVRKRGESMSPYARLQMAEALASAGDKDDAAAWVQEVLKDASEGPVSAFIPCGDGIGWSATEVETTAQGLATLVRMGLDPELQAKLARWLVAPGEHWWRCGGEDAAVVRALTMYLKAHPEATSLGPVEVEVAGHKVVATPAKVGDVAAADIPVEWLSPGKNAFTVRRAEPGEALFKVEARVFRPGLYENSKGVRVLRRFEVRNAAGVWEELNRTVKTSEPVRCTVVVWGDDLNDALRVVEPIPSGFEFIENDYGYFGRSEVRDAAIVHYLLNAGAPQVFRFFIRAESEGRLVALPATAEYLRRPAARGQSVAQPIEVKAGK